MSFSKQAVAVMLALAGSLFLNAPVALAGGRGGGGHGGGGHGGGGFHGAAAVHSGGGFHGGGFHAAAPVRGGAFRGGAVRGFEGRRGYGGYYRGGGWGWGPGIRYGNRFGWWYGGLWVPYPVLPYAGYPAPDAYYYCPSYNGYYPNVPQCPEGWTTVPATE
jgi:hypothetical protein